VPAEPTARADRNTAGTTSEENVEIVRNAFEAIYGSTSETTPTGAWTRRDSKRAERSTGAAEAATPSESWS
jgi:hypothetical protein